MWVIFYWVDDYEGLDFVRDFRSKVEAKEYAEDNNLICYQVVKVKI